MYSRHDDDQIWPSRITRNVLEKAQETWSWCTVKLIRMPVDLTEVAKIERLMYRDLD
jgi:hypothetical protein